MLESFYIFAFIRLSLLFAALKNYPISTLLDTRYFHNCTLLSIPSDAAGSRVNGSLESFDRPKKKKKLTISLSIITTTLLFPL